MFPFEEVKKDYDEYNTHSYELKEINLNKYNKLIKNKEYFEINEEDREKIHIEYDYILNIKGECIVNAANEGLLGGGGIDEAIHKACGKQLNEYIIDKFPANIYGARIYEGESVITPGFLSKFEWIIHTIAPYYDEQNRMKKEIMIKAFDSIFHIVDINNISEIILTPIGTGFYGFHMYEFTIIMFEIIKKYLEENKKINKIRIVTNLKLMFNYFKFYFN